MWRTSEFHITVQGYHPSRSAEKCPPHFVDTQFDPEAYVIMI
jgi:hypothetical protein